MSIRETLIFTLNLDPECQAWTLNPWVMWLISDPALLPVLIHYTDNSPHRIFFSHGNMSRPPAAILRNVTHLLRIPFPASDARLELEKSLAEFRTDDQIKALPSFAHIPISRMDIKVGLLSLRDPERFQAARELLRTFDYASSVSGAGATPLSVTLSGLSSGGNTEQREFTQRLYAPILGTPWLDRLREDLVTAFRNQKFTDREITCRGFYGSTFDQVSLMNLRFFRTENLNLKPSVWKYGKTVRPKIDAKNIYAKYANKVWVDHLPLDRICLSLTGLKEMVKQNKVIGAGYEDILRMPLSGTPGTILEPEDPEITYVKSMAKIRARRVVMPPVTSSETDPTEINEHRRD